MINEYTFLTDNDKSKKLNEEIIEEIMNLFIEHWELIKNEQIPPTPQLKIVGKGRVITI